LSHQGLDVARSDDGAVVHQDLVIVLLPWERAAAALAEVLSALRQSAARPTIRERRRDIL
jgi:hypothetical protein